MNTRRTSVLSFGGAIGLAVLLGACAPAASEPVPGTTPSTSNSTTASSAPPLTPAGTTAPSPPPGATAPADTAPPAEPPTSPGWNTYTTLDGDLAFDYPENWTIRAADGAVHGGVSVEVVSDTGKPIATLRTNLVTGAECEQKSPYGVIESRPLPALAQADSTPRFVFEIRSDPSQADPQKGFSGAYGITSGPEPTGPTACPIAHFFTWPPSGAAFGGVYDPFDTTHGNPPHADTPQVYAETEEFGMIRTMITSLRPAG
ncbi:hypothetical protein E2F48_15180 [Arthrobacter crusticola]|uniref:Uncharacterized protein n=1 Tax=Arthrobacter crusticola TaxID=2547960 RepID=A0A4R5TT55_9MICC|nr:hypothetical protein [Arthrobacter crusticola]TDK24112.1 hypothetical protein E2F48_15180 [Arthrobacter crusticola]